MIDDVGANFGPLSHHASTTERPMLGSTEQWSVFNFAADTHPLHLHLVQYQVVEKREIFFQDEDENGIPDDTTGDGLISHATGLSPDYSSAEIWIGDLIGPRPEKPDGRTRSMSTRARWRLSSLPSTCPASM